MVSSPLKSLGFAALAAGGLAALALAAVAAPAPAKAPLALAVPMVDVMRASVEIPADGIWGAQAADKLSDADWLLADEDSVALANAASLISLQGTGKEDAARLARPDWGPWAADIQKTALALRVAAKAKDKDKFGALADHLTETCQACHDKYRPQVPSDGVSRYPFYPARVLETSKAP